MAKAQSRALREDCLLVFGVMCDGAAGSRWFLLPQAHSLSWGELASQVPLCAHPPSLGVNSSSDPFTFAFRLA